MRPCRFISILLALLCCSAFSQAESSTGVVRIQPQDRIIELYGQWEMWRDPSGESTLEMVRDQVSRGQDSVRFRPYPRALSLGFTRDVIWIRWRMQRSPGDERDWRLTLSPSFVDRVDLYSPQADGSYRLYRGGDLIPLHQRALAVRETVMPLDVREEPQTYYLRLQSNSTVTLQAVLMDMDRYQQYAQVNDVAYGAFIGFNLTALLITLLSVVWIRESLFVKGFVFLVLQVYVVMSSQGFDQYWTNHMSGYWHQFFSTRVTGICSALMSVALIMFSLAYLQPHRYLPRYTRCLQGLAGGAFLCALMALFLDWVDIAPTFYALCLLSILALIGLLFLMLPHQPVKARLMIYTNFPSLAVVIGLVLRNVGVLPHNFWTSHLWESSVLFSGSFAILVVLQRVSEQRQLLIQSQERENFQRQLLNMVAHEFRTPLGVVQAAIGNLQAQTDRFLPDRVPDLEPRYRRIRTALTRLSTLVDSALSELRLRNGALVLTRQSLRPSELVDQVRDLLQSEGRHDLVYAPIVEDEPANLDAHWLSLALTNMVDNAFKYSPQGSQVLVQVSCDGRVFRASVSDQGVGVPQDYRQWIFEPFVRAPNVSELPGVSGMGIGLYLVHQVVQAHGGTQGVESLASGGSRFWIEINNA